MSDITVKELPAFKVISVRKEVAHKNIGSFLSSSAVTLMEYLKESGAGLAGNGFTIYHKWGEDSDMEICLPINKDVSGKRDIHFRDLPASKAAIISVKGNTKLLSGHVLLIRIYHAL